MESVDKSNLATSLLGVNSLLFKMPPKLGITSNKNHRQDHFQQSSYGPSQTMVLDCQTGSSLVDGQKSYLRFELKTLGASGVFGANGSACNVFDRITVRARNGREICRVETANLLCAFRDHYEKPKDWFDSAYAGCKGYNQTVPLTGCVVSIKLSDILPCFDTNGQVLLPAQLMEGLRIEIHTAPSAQVFATAGVTGYLIEQPRIQWSTVDLGDAFQRKLGEMASTNGLTLITKEWFHNQISGSSGGQTAFDWDVKKSCSKALKAVFISRDDADINLNSVDSMNALPYDWTRHQAHIGSSYYPMAPINVDGLVPAAAYGANDARVAEACYYSTLAWTNRTPDTTLRAFSGSNTGAESNLGALVYDFTRGMPLDGPMTNNSRSIIVSATAQADVAGNGVVRRIDGYLCFVRQIEVFTSNIVVND